MFDLFFIVSLLIFSVLCFFEFIVFNEEILLALCFFSFIFFCFNNLGTTVFESLQSRATKFESDLLVSFESEKTNIVERFAAHSKARGFSSKFAVLSSVVTVFLNTLSSYTVFKLESSFYTATLAKLAEVSALESKLVSTFQKKCVSLLFYPLIFQTVTKTESLLSSFAVSSSKSSFLFSNKITILKNL